MKTLVYLVCFASAVALALAQQNKTSPAASTLPAADINAIRANSRVFITHVLARDWTKWASLYTEDAIFLVPNTSALVGRKSIEAWANTLAPFKEFSIEPLEFHGGRDFAFVRGRFSLVATPPNQPEERDAGKYIEVWRKQPDGSWKLFRDAFNSDLPAPKAGDKTDANRRTALASRKSGAKTPGAGNLSARDQDAIRTAWNGLAAAAIARDWTKHAQFYSEDAVNLPPHDAALTGLAAITKGWSTFPAHKDWRTQPLEIGGQGDVAYVRGEWSIVMTPANQPEQPDAGKYLHVWRQRPDGTWKLHHDIWNSDLPVQ